MQGGSDSKVVGAISKEFKRTEKNQKGLRYPAQIHTSDGSGSP